MTSILSEHQKRLLALLGSERIVANSFYFTGGTVLAEYYLHHRLSEDLDFFCEDEVPSDAVLAVLKSIQARAGIESIRFEQSFNRNLFFLEVGGETIKTEFTYFPFPRIDKTKKQGGLAVDSLTDIAVNKVFTIFQKPRSRDFVDLFCIMREKKWTMADLVAKAQIKFDTYMDPIQLGAQLLRAEALRDYPRMLIPLEPRERQAFFKEEAKKLGPQVLD